MIFMSVGYLSQEQWVKKVIMREDYCDCYAFGADVGVEYHDHDFGFAVDDELKSNDRDNYDCKGIISDGKVR